MPQNPEEIRKKMAPVIAKAWSDENFKKNLMEHPDEVLKENGIEVPEGIHFKVVENSKETCYVVLPQKPEGSLSEEDLKKLSGGSPCVLSDNVAYK